MTPADERPNVIIFRVHSLGYKITPNDESTKQHLVKFFIYTNASEYRYNPFQHDMALYSTQ